MTQIMAAARRWAAHDNLGEEELVALARGRDDGAVRELIRRYNQRLFRIARGVVRDESEAEDIVQETYVRAFTGLDGFRGEAAFSTWLTRIALNEAVGRMRRRQPTVELAEAEAEQGETPRLVLSLIQPTESPESSTGRAEVRRMLERALEELPEPFRMAFLLRDIEGLTVEETATLLSIRPETVKTRLFRARRLMRRQLQEALSPAFSEVFPFAGQRCAEMARRVLARLGGATS